MNRTTLIPIALALLITAFYLGLPDLRSCALDIEGEDKKLSLKDGLIILIISAIYAFAAFTNLGDTSAPQTFEKTESSSHVIDFGSETSIGSVMAYEGINTGNYTFSFSEDGAYYYGFEKLEQNYTDLLKWHGIEFNDGKGYSARYVRIVSSGNPWLGELAFYDCDGSGLQPVKYPEALFDEQDTVPDEPGFMNSSYFDEIYHVRTAVEHLNAITPYEISHPPLGKLIISLGILIFGLCPFGWRFMGTLFGVLMLPVIYVFAKKISGGKLIPACAAVIAASGFMHFTQTRIATIDTYAVFFILLMYLFMYLYVTEGKTKNLALSGVFFGIGAACKWTCLYAGAGLAVIWLVYRLSHLKTDGFKGFIKNCLFCVVFFVIIPAAIYYCSYYPYGRAAGLSGPGSFLTKEYAGIVLKNQSFMFNYHSNVTATHPYSSKWYQWLLDIRPILYYLNYFSDGTRSSIAAFVNPLVCWAGFIGFFALTAVAIARKDVTAAFLVAAYLAQLIPWIPISRITFEYHYFPCAAFLVLMLAYVFKVFKLNKPGWKVYVLAVTACSAALFAAFYPVLSGKAVNVSYASSVLSWFGTWPF